MKICYIPPVALAGTSNNILEKAISDAIQKTLVMPFKLWMLETWIKFVKVSFVLCLAIAITGYILGVMGINKGYKLAILSLVFYLLISMISYLNGWC